MNNLIPFQYSILRYIHDLETGEFLNVGLALYSKQGKYFRAQLLNKYGRITDTFPGADGEYFRRYINNFQRILYGLSNKINSNQIDMFPKQVDKIENLLASVLPPDDASIRFSEPHEGLVEDLDVVFDELYIRLVEQYLKVPERESRTDDEVWQAYQNPLKELS